jgi:hypothetical protein
MRLIRSYTIALDTEAQAAVFPLGTQQQRLPVVSGAVAPQI